MSATSLIPCPFCGSEAILRQALGEYWVECDNGHQGATAHSSETAIESWNQSPELAKEESQKTSIKRRIFIIALSPLVILLVLTEFLGWAMVDSSQFLYRKLCEIKESA